MRRSWVDRNLTCRELVELVTDYFEHALAAPARERFEAHVAECEACERYLQQIRTTIRLTGEMRALEEHPETTALLAVFRGYRRGT